MSISLTNNSSYAYIVFDGSSGDYDYKLTLVAPYGSRAGTPNTVQDSTMSSPWEFVASINGGFFFPDGSSYFANGLEKQHYTWNEQYDDPEHDSVLAVGSNGADNTSLTFAVQSSMRDWSGDWALTGGISLSGGSYISTDVNTSTGHSFIGQSGSSIIMGVSKSGVAGATLRSYVSGLGYTGVELDGGGSTSFMYNGTQYSNKYDGRQVKNVICLYRKQKTSPTPTPTGKYVVNLDTSPAYGGRCTGYGAYDSGTEATFTAIPNAGYKFSKWSDGYPYSPRYWTIDTSFSLTAYFVKNEEADSRKLGAVSGVSYVYKDGALKQANPWYRNNNGALQGRPKGIYMMQNNELIPLILKYFVNFNSNGGSDVAQQNYYSVIESIDSLPTPTHSSYDSRSVIFDGWFYDNNFETCAGSLTATATGDREYCAKWVQSKTQYSGSYTTSSSTSQSIPSDSYSGSSSPVYFRCGGSSPVTHSSAITITSINADFDNCLSDWTDYVKPQVDYGYFTGGEGSSYYTNVGSLYSQGESPSTKTVSYTLPQGSSMGFRVYQSGSRTKLYLNSGSYSYGGSSSSYADWQDSSSPPSGSWDSGYPIRRNVSRYYNGSSWTSWE